MARFCRAWSLAAVTAVFEVQGGRHLIPMTADECRTPAARLLRLADAADPEGWQRGCIVSYNPSRQFGFVQPDEGGADIWFRKEYTSLADDELRPGQRVEYLVADVSGKTRISAMRLVRE